MADHRYVALQGASACGRGCWREPGDGPDKRGLNTKLHLAVDAHGLPVQGDWTKAVKWIFELLH